jgi:hypothetical protein
MDDNEKSEFTGLIQAFHAAKERGELGQAESIGFQILSFSAEEAERNSSESLRLILEAHEHEDAARWEQYNCVRSIRSEPSSILETVLRVTFCQPASSNRSAR